MSAASVEEGSWKNWDQTGNNTLARSVVAHFRTIQNIDHKLPPG
jgi:hypothetical protein